MSDQLRLNMSVEKAKELSACLDGIIGNANLGGETDETPLREFWDMLKVSITYAEGFAEGFITFANEDQP